jgi:hypothetical protein
MEAAWCPVQRVAAVAQQHGHGLAGIDDAAAADRHHHVGAMFASRGDRGPDQLNRGLGGHRKRRRGQPQAGQQSGVTGRVRTGDHQHPGPEPGQQARQLLRPAGTGHDAPGGGEVKARRGHRGTP